MALGTVLVTGSSRGLGLELVRQLIPIANKVIATCRDPGSAQDLTRVAAKSSNILVKQLDIVKFETFSTFVEDLQNSAEIKASGISCLINNAGHSPKSTRYNLVTAEQMTKTFQVNSVAPLMLTKALIPLLKLQPGSLIVNISSILGSIQQNDLELGSSGGLYPYRGSKAALNMITRSLCIDLKPLGISAVAIHPGWVKTDMGGKNAPLTPEESIEGVLNVLKNFNAKEQNGKFVDYQGKTLPW